MPQGAPDARLSNFRLDRLLGSGGMGAVYLARDLTLNRDVAIKFISPG
jgi:serine/threonine protein kinase